MLRRIKFRDRQVHKWLAYRPARAVSNGYDSCHDPWDWIDASEANAPLIAEYPEAEDVEDDEEALLERPAERLRVMQSVHRALFWFARPRQPRS